MITLIHAILLLFILKGITYLFFPNWVKMYLSETILELPIGRLKALGLAFIMLSLVAWIGWVQHM